MKKLSFLNYLLCALTGADMPTLVRAGSTEITLLAITGSIVLITPILGVLTGFFAVFTLTNNLLISVAAGSIWGFVILLLERSVVANAKPGEFSFMLIGRILLAIVFALVISKPLELRIFDDAIQERLSRNLESSKMLINREADRQIAEHRSHISTERTRNKELRASYITEVDGQGGSGHTGFGLIAQAKLRTYQIDSIEAAQIIREHTQEIARIDAQRQQDIQHLIIHQANGLLGQLRALSDLSSENATVRWSTYVIMLLFLLIELLPLLTKVSSDGGVLYHKILQRTRDNVLAAFEQQNEGDLKVVNRRNELDMERELHELQMASLKLATSHAVEGFSVISEQLQRATNKKLRLEKEIFETVADEAVRALMLENVNIVYNNFMAKLKQLLAEPDTTHPPFSPNF